MNSLKALLKVEFTSFLKINQLTKRNYDKKSRYEMLAKLIIYIIFFVVFGFCSAEAAYGLISLGIEKLLFAALTMMVSAIIFIIIIFKQLVLFRRSDYDMLVSLPIKTSWIVFAKLSVFLVQSILISCVFYIPAGIVYGVHSRADVLYYIMLLIVTLIAPLIPFVVALIIGAIISYTSSAITSSFNNALKIIARIGGVVLFGILVVLYEYFLINAQKFANSKIITEAVSYLMQMFSTATLVSNILNERDILNFFIYLVLSAAAFVIAMEVTAFFFHRINLKLMQTKAKGNYKLKYLKASSQFVAVLKMEIKRYFSISIYVFNTMGGAVLSLAVAFIIMLISPESIIHLANIKGITVETFTGIILKILPMLTVAMLAINNTTNASISIEGNTFWLTSSLPVQPETVYLSKIIVDLIVFLPVGLISTIIFAIKFKIGVVGIVALFLTPFSVLPFLAVIGLLLNIKFPNFDFQNPVEVTKQGTPVMVSVFTGMATDVLLAIASLYLSYVGVILIDALLLIAIYVIWRKISRIRFNSILSE